MTKARIAITTSIVAMAAALFATTASAQQQVRVGSTIAGELRSGDDRLRSGELADNYVIDGRAGETVTIRMNSSALDPYLLVRGPGGVSEDNDDAAQGNLNSEITLRFPQTGRYTITATTYQPGETGAYRLSIAAGGEVAVANDVKPEDSDTPAASSRGVRGPVRAVASSPEDVDFDAVPQSSIRALNASSDRASGELRGGGEQRRTGQDIRYYTLNGRAGQQVQMRLASTDFDTYLRLSGPAGYVYVNDDATGDGTNSQLTATLPSDGTYYVGVSSYGTGESGSYTLTVGDAATAAIAAAPAAREAEAGPATPIMMGRTVTGQLGRAGRGNDNAGNTYSFTGRRGQRVRIDVESDAFDPVATLQPPGALDAFENDDGDGTGLNSRIDDVLPADGVYRLTVRAYGDDGSGAYRVTVAPSDGPERIANVRGGPRVFALSVGVSDYGGSTSNLPFTDDDAVKLSQTLRRAGVLNPASITLTNADATVDSVRAAFARVASQAGPDDVFLFFFSGHGVQENGRVSATEPDGRDEELVMRDGNISDDELARLFGTLNTRMAVAIIDACFSGGFGRDLVNRPGVMGFFSSEEDLTSLVADKFEAGGYLAHFVRAGFQGQADANGDNAISVGELSTYVRTRFNAPDVGMLEATTTEGQRNYQNLVIERGGVQVDDILVRLGPAPR